MNCEECDERLVEYLYDELSSEQTASLQQALELCPDCRKRYDQLKAIRTLASEELYPQPPSSLSQLVLQQINAHPVPAPPQPPRGVIARAGEPHWYTRARDLIRWAAGPQVTMAMLLLLMVGIGLWHVPRLQQTSAPAARPVVESSPAPAKQAPAAEMQAGAPSPPTAEPAAKPAKDEAGNTRYAVRPPALGAASREEAEAAPVGQRRSGSNDYQRRTADQSVKESYALADRAAEEAQGEAVQTEARAPESKAISGAAPGVAEGAAANAATARPASRARSAASNDDVQAAADLVMARKYRAAGDCARAVRLYERALSARTRSNDTQAMSEIAQCYERLGQPDVAARWSARAKRGGGQMTSTPESDASGSPTRPARTDDAQ
jgi:hypothetical protein